MCIRDRVNASKLSKADLKDQQATATALERLQAYFEKYAPELTVEFEIKKDAEHGGFKIVAPPRYGGARKLTVVDFAFLDSPEYEELGRLGADLGQFGPPPYTLERRQPEKG